MENLYSTTVKEASEIDLSRVSEENKDFDALLVTGGKDQFLFMLSHAFLSGFYKEDNLFIDGYIGKRPSIGPYILSPSWGYDEFVVQQATPNSVSFVPFSKTDDSQIATIMTHHRAIVIQGKGCVALVKNQLKEARKYKREITIKVHKM